MGEKRPGSFGPSAKPPAIFCYGAVGLLIPRESLLSRKYLFQYLELSGFAQERFQ